MKESRALGCGRSNALVAQSGTKQLEFTFLSIGAGSYRIIYSPILYSIRKIGGETDPLYRMWGGGSLYNLLLTHSLTYGVLL
jgi:hypothetical protein